MDCGFSRLERTHVIKRCAECQRDCTARAPPKAEHIRVLIEADGIEIAVKPQQRGNHAIAKEFDESGV
jgi:hypothetical protein